MAVSPMETPATPGKSSHRALSTAFITDFVRACFTEDLCDVDFTQSLTAMGYLQQLEDKRMNEFNSATRRLRIDVEALKRDRKAFEEKRPEIYDWFTTMELKAKKVEALYTQVYVGLRRWAMINEMRLTPFSKANCISMLNILYPPTYGTIPTSQLTEHTLNAQRNAYFRYIQAVEKSGKDVLINLEQASRRAGEINGWSVVRDIVDVYFRKAGAIIEDCRAAKSAKDFEIVNKEKRTDSGVSFASTISNFSTPERKPITTLRPALVTRPSTSMGSTSAIDDTEFMTPNERKGNNKFERFTRRLKSRSADNRSQSPPQLEKRPSFNERQNSLRKMKSTSNLNRDMSKKDDKYSRENSSDRSGLPQFTIDDAQRERLIREARQDKENNPIIKRQPSPTQHIYRPKTREAHLAIPAEEAFPTSCRITRLDHHEDPYRLPTLALPPLRI